MTMNKTLEVLEVQRFPLVKLGYDVRRDSERQASDGQWYWTMMRIPMKPTTCSTGMHATHSIPNSAIYPDPNPASDSISKSAIGSELCD